MKYNNNMKKQDLNNWYKLLKQLNNGKMKNSYSKDEDYRELIRLNHLVMEATNKIHNDHMMSKDW